MIPVAAFEPAAALAAIGLGGIVLVGILASIPTRVSVRPSSAHTEDKGEGGQQ